MTLDDLPVRLPVTAGALIRRDIRAFLDLHGIAYIEHKGWFDSEFVVTIVDADQARAWNWLRDRFGDDT